jgi:hypothetical protein
MTPFILDFVANGLLKRAEIAGQKGKYYFCCVKLQHGNHSGSTFEND